CRPVPGPIPSTWSPSDGSTPRRSRSGEIGCGKSRIQRSEYGNGALSSRLQRRDATPAPSAKKADARTRRRSSASTDRSPAPSATNQAVSRFLTRLLDRAGVAQLGELVGAETPVGERF